MPHTNAPKINLLKTGVKLDDFISMSKNIIIIIVVVWKKTLTFCWTPAQRSFAPGTWNPCKTFPPEGTQIHSCILRNLQNVTNTQVSKYANAPANISVTVNIKVISRWTDLLNS